MKLAPTFKLVDGVWHLTRFKDLKKGDIIKSFNDSELQKEGFPADFELLRRWVCISDPYLANAGPDGAEVWTIQCDLESEHDNNS